MARNLIRVSLELDSIKCHDEGDGLGSAEPYLWTVFFKVDGSTVQVTDSLTLSGSPTVETTPGSHGNLGGDNDVDEGDTVTIPAAIGEFETILSPIPVPESLSSLAEDIGGVVGVVAVLMESDNVTDDGAEAGHAGLNNAVQSAIQEIINTRSFTNQDITEGEIQAFTDSIGAKVEAAIREEQNFFENVWSWLNPDDMIGSKVFLCKHDDLDPSAVFEFSHRWKNEGDWEIFGHIASTVLCPASALRDILEALFGDEQHRSSKRDRETPNAGEFLYRMRRDAKAVLGIDLAPLRKFRDAEYRSMPGLARWFGLAERHSARLAWLIARNPELGQSARALLEWGSVIAAEPDAAITKEQLEHARRLAGALAGLPSRRARMDGSRALSLLAHLEGRSNRAALALLNAVPPARHPNAGGARGLRVRVKPPNT